MFKKCLLLLPSVTWALSVQPGDFGLEISPWLGNLWEFEFTPSYSYSFYPQVQNGYPVMKKAAHDNLLTGNMSVSPFETWGADLEVEFSGTPYQLMGYRSIAFQLRKEWLNDMMGDAVAFTSGASIRGVSRHSLKDPGCPYHSDVNVELNSALGKEWDRGMGWVFRAFGWAGIGMANHGSPWLRGFLSCEGEAHQTHRFGVWTTGYFGFGPNHQVKINHFHGYASIHHQSIDVGAQYAYIFERWGFFAFTYAYRAYALSFPERNNFFTLSYTLPFSFF